MMWQYPEQPARTLSPLVLAYVGDAVFELYVRTALLNEKSKVHQLHKRAVDLVKAEAMAGYYQKLAPHLQPDEEAVIRRGRNAKSRSGKSSDAQSYHMSTGFEALVGYLYLDHQEQRLQQLLAFVLPELQHNEHTNRP